RAGGAGGEVNVQPAAVENQAGRRDAGVADRERARGADRARVERGAGGGGKIAEDAAAALDGLIRSDGDRAAVGAVTGAVLDLDGAGGDVGARAEVERALGDGDVAAVRVGDVPPLERAGTGLGDVPGAA